MNDVAKTNGKCVFIILYAKGNLNTVLELILVVFLAILAVRVYSANSNDHQYKSPLIHYTVNLYLEGRLFALYSKGADVKMNIFNLFIGV